MPKNTEKTNVSKTKVKKKEYSDFDKRTFKGKLKTLDLRILIVFEELENLKKEFEKIKDTLERVSDRLGI